MKKPNRPNPMPAIVAVLVIVVIIFAAIFFCRPINKVTDRREITVTVTEKGIKKESNNDRYLIYTKTAEGEIQVFEITDSLFAFRFNSSDVYAGIEVGKTYRFDIGGSRSAIRSWYPNIYGYTEIK